jgi:hypothetical protein
VKEGNEEREMIPCSISTGFSTSIEWLLETIILGCNHMQKHFELLMLPQCQLFASLTVIYLHG